MGHAKQKKQRCHTKTESAEQPMTFAAQSQNQSAAPTARRTTTRAKQRKQVFEQKTVRAVLQTHAQQSAAAATNQSAATMATCSTMRVLQSAKRSKCHLQ